MMRHTAALLPLREQGHFNPDSHHLTPISEAEVVVPSDMMAIGDCYNASVEFTRRRLVEAQGYGNILTRHQGRANALFCDGHVESPRLRLLFDDTSDTALARWNRDHLPHLDRL